MKKITIVLIVAMLLVSLMVACTPRSVVDMFYGLASSGDAGYGSPDESIFIQRYVTDVNAMTASYGNLFLTSAGEVVYVPYYTYSTDGNAWVSGGNAWVTGGNALTTGGNAVATNGNAVPAN